MNKKFIFLLGAVAIVCGVLLFTADRGHVVSVPDVEKDEEIRTDVVVTSPVSGANVTSPLTVTGTARGWYFEGSFPVVLTDGNGEIIAEGVATAQGDWMTSDPVPFTSTLTFSKQTPKTQGILTLKKDNPSGLPSNDASIEIPVTFE